MGIVQNSIVGALVAVGWASAAQAVDINVSPVNNLQATVNSASNGDRLLLAPGTYNQTIFIDGKSLTIEGTGGAAATTITAEFLNDTVIRVNNAPDPGVTLRGLTIRDGVAPTAGTGNAYPYDGGGVSSFNGALTIEDCHLTMNHASDDGGAVFSSGTLVCTNTTFDMNTSNDVGAGVLASPTASFTNCEFTVNIAGGRGGAAYVYSSGDHDFTNCTFSDNESGSEGGALAVFGTNNFDQCVFERNYALVQGGAIFTNSGTLTCANTSFTENYVDQSNGDAGAILCDTVTATLTDCAFVRNSAPDDGGAILCWDGGRIDLLRCVFLGNTGERGGAFRISAPTAAAADNCLFIGNTALTTGFGGALYTAPNTAASSTYFRNCSFYGNQGPQSVVGGAPSSSGVSRFTNCVMWASQTLDSAFGSNQQVRYCNVQRSSGVQSGVGNMNAAPIFAALPNPGVDVTWGTMDDVYGDLRLLAGSAGIDAGDSFAASDLLGDYDGNDRNVDDPATVNTGVSAWALCVDTGAFEFQPTGAGFTCEGDANGDGVIDLDDIQVVLFGFGTSCN
ncbi:MAG: hypothetical protein KDA20_06325 [Phycisphaerales bacterium]|nr:hypothetical protein [Phycisphaerales bacterium]